MEVDLEDGTRVEGDKACLLEVQERLLAEKLWEYLVGLGHSPSPLDEPCASPLEPESNAGTATLLLVSVGLFSFFFFFLSKAQNRLQFLMKSPCPFKC